ncbi:MAG TPA: hypothetical protein VNT99_05630 [Methylomirabilota bacterium]|nr:hypothetical protein [Methylomirabilota bacterium]
MRVGFVLLDQVHELVVLGDAARRRLHRGDDAVRVVDGPVMVIAQAAAFSLAADQRGVGVGGRDVRVVDRHVAFRRDGGHGLTPWVTL